MYNKKSQTVVFNGYFTNPVYFAFAKLFIHSEWRRLGEALKKRNVSLVHELDIKGINNMKTLTNDCVRTISGGELPPDIVPTFPED
ncbi:hypothetical protein CWB99_12305 [Pseudoalteromonas rubra]|uniref:Uncharacterized protein n=1 Tax=Pseudoalteromonas rubra TaxID=43658 RepID=A0A5S3WLV1_9GAMM|nr:hypothetical protein [Pseudoalteromonas rubra]TMP28186.1 hypothetical protein CWB99_12305 [Pseudoalteromonas rubra]TMP34888.1 hypothetical protein CWC00_05935 [Pseudoalteromonas rubra]